MLETVIFVLLFAEKVRVFGFGFGFGFGFWFCMLQTVVPGVFPSLWLWMAYLSVHGRGKGYLFLHRGPENVHCIIDGRVVNKLLLWGEWTISFILSSN